MNPSPAASFLRACRANSSRTLVLHPAPSTSPARAQFNSKSQLLQCQRISLLERRTAFSTCSAVWNTETITGASRPSGRPGIDKTIQGNVASNSTAGTTTLKSNGTPTPSNESGSEQGSQRRPTTYPVWKGRSAEFVKNTTRYTGRVTRTGTMRKTVRVSRNVQVWDQHLQKHYTRAAHALVHDPDELLVEGDVVVYGAFPPRMEKERIAKGRPVATKGKVAFTVFHILTPFGTSIEARLEAKYPHLESSTPRSKKSVPEHITADLTS